MHTAGPAARTIGAVNWLGLWTLYVREVRRFLKVYMQTVAAPVVTTLLFLAIFLLALGGQTRMIGAIPYTEFLAPGLIMMAMVQNAFANTSSSLMIAKVQGNIVDVLMPPLGPGELVWGFALGGVTRGLVVGVVVAAVIAIFVPLHVYNYGLMLFHSVAASLCLSVLGIIGAIWADKFDHIAAVTNFVVTPLSFLSGTFYSINVLPGIWRDVALANPFFYMIDGFRYGLTGHADSSLVVGVIVMIVTNTALIVLCHAMFKRGYKLKA
ncbi:MAG TPA: ABC transporter permease [Stellaceae bacterium]|jgi:ABC-2 type transport system permease protein|nr:ABC transporter permease [Stellaceae bacterium]